MMNVCSGSSEVEVKLDIALENLKEARALLSEVTENEHNQFFECAVETYEGGTNMAAWQGRVKSFLAKGQA